MANCDPATVSRATNDFIKVHPDTRDRIMAAIHELGYEPLMTKKGIQRRLHHAIGVIVPNTNVNEFADIIGSIDSKARECGYCIRLAYTDDDSEIERERLELFRYMTDGLIIAATGKNMSLIHDIHNQGIAVVQIIRKQDDSLSSIVSDYEGGSYDAVHYLYSKGCRNIGLINGPSNSRPILKPYRTRYDGYKRAISELGLKEICECTSGIINGYESGTQCIEKMIDENPGLDAIMTAVDIYGMAALRITRQRGINVPEQIRIVSLTGCYVGNLLEKSLTSFELPAVEIGANAARMVIEEIESPVGKKTSIQHLTFAASLSERESS